MKLLKVNNFYFVLLVTIILSFMIIMGLICFLPIEKSIKITLHVNDHHQNSVTVDSNTANLLKNHKDISILFNNHVYKAWVKAIVVKKHDFEVILGGMDGKLLPGSQVQATIIYDTTSLFKTLLKI